MDQETLLNVVRVLIPNTTDIIACEPPEVWMELELELQEIYNSDTDPGGDSSDLERRGGSIHPHLQQRRSDPSVSPE